MSFGSSPKQPVPQEMPVTPTIDDASRDRDVNDAMRRRKGRAAAILAGKNSGSTKSVGAATKTLMGG